MQYDWLGEIKNLLACWEQIDAFAAQLAARVAAPRGGGASEDRAVAWVVKHQDGWIQNVYTEKRAAESWVYPGGPYRVVPLYAHPAPPAPDSSAKEAK